MARKRRRLAPSSDSSRRRRADASSCADASKCAEVTKLSTLPFELLTLIVELACYPVDDASPSWGRRTLRSLSLISRHFYHVTRPIVFRRISVSKPSSLYALWRLLTRRPELGELIRELHIGPQDIVPSFWWPLRIGSHDWNGDCENRLAIHLDSWESPADFYHRSWDLCARPKTCMEVAIAKALAVAQDHLRPRVDLMTEYPQGQAILQRVFEIQAVLELYLIELRRLEDLDPARRDRTATGACYSGRCKRYPPFVIDDGSRRSPRRPGPKGALVLTREQLHQHPFRPGGSADDFEHPLLYARSGVPVSYNSSEILSRKEGHVGYASCLMGTAEWEKNGAKDLAAFVRGGCRHDGVQPIDESESVPITTLKSTLAWARAVLACATNVQKLSLTGYVEQVTCSGLDLPSVQRLSIGPAPSFLRSQFDLRGFPNVKELRLCADRIPHEDVERLASTPLLKKMLWNSPIRHEQAAATEIVEATNKLIGRKTSGGDEREISEADRNAYRSRPFPPLVQVRMHHSNLDWMVATAPSAEVENIWLTGAPLSSARRRLLLLECEETVTKEDIFNECGREKCGNVWAEHYLQATEWWEEGRPGGSV